MAAKKTTAAPSQETGEERVMIVIPKPNNVIGDTETTVSINGTMYQIQYDRPVYVPKAVADVVEQSLELQRKIEAAKAAAAPGRGAAPLAEL